MDKENLLQLYYRKQSEIYRLECIDSLLGWDQQVYMPAGAAQARAEQVEYIAQLLHARKTDSEFSKAVDELYGALDELSIEDQVNIRETKRVLDIQRKLPEDFVAEEAKAHAEGYSIWLKARPADDFDAVRPSLEKIVDLAKKRSELVGYEKHPYDALLDIYEPGSTIAFVKPLLAGLAVKLKELIPPISEKFRLHPKMKGDFSQERQQMLNRKVAEGLGFSFESGRFDVTAHPFMTTLGPRDFRITTHYNQSSIVQALYSTIHETGHALYEMGLPAKYAGTPMGEAVSLSIHESQSRLWENLVGRSRDFCAYLKTILPGYFPETQDMSVDELWLQVNMVEPSLIRIDADEVTYSQHVVIRMLLEEQLITGELSVKELPSAWNDLYEEYLGIRPPDNKDGVMQDVHWYSGSIGYFPTYALGNLYNSMMIKSAEQAVPDLWEQISSGDFIHLLGWLQENIYKHGKRFRGPELIKRITGEELSIQPFVDYLSSKFLA